MAHIVEKRSGSRDHVIVPIAEIIAPARVNEGQTQGYFEVSSLQ